MSFASVGIPSWIIPQVRKLSNEGLCATVANIGQEEDFEAAKKKALTGRFLKERENVNCCIHTNLLISWRLCCAC